jgi:hypothetical protein
MEALMTKIPVGKFRTPAVGSREAEAYVEDGGIGSFVPESTYGARNYQPPFDDLPTQEQYNDTAAKTAFDVISDLAAMPPQDR